MCVFFCTFAAEFNVYTRDNKEKPIFFHLTLIQTILYETTF